MTTYCQKKYMALLWEVYFAIFDGIRSMICVAIGILKELAVSDNHEDNN